MTTDLDQALVSEFKSLLQLERETSGRNLDQKLIAFREEMDQKWRTFLQKGSKPPVGFGWNEKPPTLGATFLQSPQWKSFQSTGQNRSGQFAMERKAVTPLIAPPFPITAGRVGDAPNVYAPLTLRTLLNPVPITEGAIEYLRQKPTTGTAAVQWPQGATKAQLSLDFELALAQVITIAAYTKASRQVLSDEAQVEALIDGELMYQVDLAEELEILNGDNSPGHMWGLLPQAPVFTATAGMSSIDIIGAAQGQIAALGYPVTGTVLNPIDWTKMSQAKAVGSGTYLIGNPGQGATAPYLWNVPLVQSSNIPAGTFLTGAFGFAARLYDREQRVEVSRENEDDFVRNLVTILGEIRSALVVRRPAGFLKGSLTAPAAARQEAEKK